MTDVRVMIIKEGLKAGHEFYSMDITGFEAIHKKFLTDRLNTEHEYSWLVNLDDSENEKGYHLLYVKGDPHDIDKVIGELITSTEEDDTPAFAPTFNQVDPDATSAWSPLSVRQRFEQKASNQVTEENENQFTHR